MKIFSSRAHLRSALVSAAGAWLFVLGCVASGATEPRTFTADLEPPYATQWGDYVVTVVSLSVREQRFRISDPGGEVRREIRAPYINLVDFPDLDGRHGHDFLRVITHPESNTLGDIRTYCFTRRGGLRNVLTMPYGFDSARDLNGDGYPELISDDPAPLEWTAGLCHGCSPTVMVVLRWDGKQYAVANRRFPKVAREKAKSYRDEFLKGIVQMENSRTTGNLTYDEIMSSALGYWASLVTIGEEQTAQQWVVKKLPPGMRQQFLESLPEVRERLAQLTGQITVDQRQRIAGVQ